MSKDNFLDPKEQLREFLRDWKATIYYEELEKFIKGNNQISPQEALKDQSNLDDAFNEPENEEVQKGILRGVAKAFIYQLEMEFNDIPNFYYQKIHQATEEEILKWCSRILRIKDLEIIFSEAKEEID